MGSNRSIQIISGAAQLMRPPGRWRCGGEGAHG